MGVVEASNDDGCNAIIRSAEFGLGGGDVISKTHHKPAPFEDRQALRRVNGRVPMSGASLDAPQYGSCPFR